MTVYGSNLSYDNRVIKQLPSYKLWLRVDKSIIEKSRLETGLVWKSLRLLFILAKMKLGLQKLLENQINGLNWLKKVPNNDIQYLESVFEEK